MEMTESLERFVQFIRSVLDKPGMFLVNNVEDLHLVLFGYCAASGTETEKFLLEFGSYVNDEFELQSEYGWAAIIRLQSGGDQSSLELFTLKFNKFLEQNFRKKRLKKY